MADVALSSARKKYKCKYPGCESYYYSRVKGDYTNKRFFRFPKDEKRVEVWRNVLKIPTSANVKNWSICEAHFTMNDFVNSRKERIHYGAVPIPYEGEVCFENNISTDLNRRREILSDINREHDYYDVGSSSSGDQDVDHDYAVSSSSPPSSPLLPQTVPDVVKPNAAPPQTVTESVKPNEIPTAGVRFTEGIKPDVRSGLAVRVAQMEKSHRFCSLLFEQREHALGFHPDKVTEYISSNATEAPKATNVLVFMIRGIDHPWSQLVACYFTQTSVPSVNLQFLIMLIISELVEIGLTVVATVCEQTSVNCAAMTKLCGNNSCYFYVRMRSHFQVFVIFDAWGLLKQTRDALVKCKIKFAPDKCAQFDYIRKAFKADQKRRFRLLQLEEGHFDFQDPNVKNDVKIAAAQLSYKMACTIETYSVCCSVLPFDAFNTAEFTAKIENLLDSLTSSGRRAEEYEPFKSGLFDGAPHFQLWLKLVKELKEWQLIDLQTGSDVTKDYLFVTGWQMTMQSVVFLWNRLHNIDHFKHLDLAHLSRDPLDTLFSSIERQDCVGTLILESLGK